MLYDDRPEKTSGQQQKPGPVLAVQILLWSTLAIEICAGGVNSAGAAAILMDKSLLADTGLSEGAIPLILAMGLLVFVAAIACGVLAFLVGRRLARVRMGGMVAGGVLGGANLASFAVQGGALAILGALLGAAIVLLMGSRPAKAWFTR